VQLGEELSEYQALQALLLPSANNIAETLARWAFGSIDAYNAYANQ
jgi:D-alanyl-D-alanine carboxypeptidase (penicillin-binding protein 5/6)